jgi:hypothetical protein
LIGEARAELDRIAASLAEAHPESIAATGFVAIPLREWRFGNVRTPLLVILAAVGFGSVSVASTSCSRRPSP